MCGICCFLFAENERSRSNFQVVSKSVLPHLERRGPDHTGTKEFFITNDHETFFLTLIGTVLHLRGSKTPQPLIDECGNILLWNGEIFGGVEVKENENDSFVLLKMLSSHLSGMTYAEHILSTMAKVQGPWSFVYWQATEQKMWFGRDYFGRRSLLWHLPSSSDDVLAVTSVTERNSTSTDYNLRFEEVPADGLYCVDFMDLRSGQDYKQPFRISKFEWKSINDELQNELFLACPVLPFNKQMPNEEDLQVIDENRRRVCPLNKREMEGNFPKERITLVEKANDPKEAEEHVPENDISCREIAENTTELDNLEIKDARLKCDLEKINCLEGCVNSVDANMCPSYPTSTRNIEFDVSKEQYIPDSNSLLNTNHCSVGASSHILTLNEASDRKNIPQGCCRNSLLNSPWNSSFEESRDKFIAVLGEAVRKRVFNLPRTNDNSVSSCSQETLSRLIAAGSVSQEQSFASSGATENDARVGILFSGGVDSMMVAVLADKFVPSGEAIDLINVAFEQKSQPVIPQNKTGKKRKTRPNATSPKPKEINFSVPDRITGIAGLEELQHINPARRWNFIEVDVTLEELQEMRSRHISHLVSPLNTVLDDSIGCALWFAARGRGRLHSSSVNAGLTDSVVENREEEYTSKAKVLLVGMGADEQLGGYARHRTRFLNEGWSGLMDEMEMEVKRISKRNLGRDDRCISDHGREARFPFLDEEVVSFLNSLPVWVKTDPGLPRGTGEKLLLRQAAKLLGMTSSAELPKRAIQFGSRIAKLESSGEKGSEACSRLEV